MASEPGAASLREYGTNALIEELRRRGDLGLAARAAKRDALRDRKAALWREAIQKVRRLA